MPKLIFRGAFIRFVDLRYDDKSKVAYTKLNFTAAFSDPIREAMEWGEPPAGFNSAKLDGTLTATNLILTPNGKELKQHEIQIDCKEISGFEFVSVKEGDSTRQELRFQIVTAVDGAEAIIGAYIRAIGKGEGQLRIGYEQQAEMPLEEEKQDRLISKEQAADTSEEADEPEEAGAPLASAAVMGTGTHQAKRKPREDRGTVN